MSYSVNWITKVITVPLADLTFVSGVNYTLDTSDFWIEVRRLEASPANGGGLWAEQMLEFINTQSLSGDNYSAIVKLINGYTWDIDATNINVSLTGKNSNLLDFYIPSNGVSVLANNSAGKTDNTAAIAVATAAEMFSTIMEDGETFATSMRLIRAAAVGDIVVTDLDNGAYEIMSRDGLTIRITGSGDNTHRTITAVDGS